VDRWASAVTGTPGPASGAASGPVSGAAAQAALVRDAVDGLLGVAL
jgi:hypothetical protein